MERGERGKQGSEGNRGTKAPGARPSWTGSCGTSTWSSTSAPASTCCAGVPERFRQDVPITFTVQQALVGQRSTASYAAGRTKATTPTTPPPHDNHAYVVRPKRSGPGGPGRAPVGFELPGRRWQKGVRGQCPGGRAGSARERNPLPDDPRVDGETPGVRTMRTMRTMRTVRTGPGARAGARGAPRGWHCWGRWTGAYTAPPGRAPRRNRSRQRQQRAGAGAGAGTGSRRLRIGVSFEVGNLSPYDNGYWLTSYGTGQSLYRVTPDESWCPGSPAASSRTARTATPSSSTRRRKFHNGKPIDARRCRGASSATSTPAASRALAQGRAVRVPGPTTLRIKTVRARPLAAELPGHCGYHAHVRPGRGAAEVGPGTLLGKGFYSGPFRATAPDPRST